MPLMRLSDTEAISNRKTNLVAGWGERGKSNRVEPITSPDFAVPFKIVPGDRIFTIGSCFARNVEGELLRLGFAIPMRDIFRRADFANLDLDIINNYGTPSIFNEIAWAFDEQAFDPEKHLLEVREGLFADIHLSPTIRPEPWHVVIARRQAIAEAYRLAAACSLVIMTLGLCEVWFDTLSGCYINVAPRPSLVTRHPGRFELHVLSFDETYRYLAHSIRILHKHAPQLQILLSVSPVPLMLTHRPMDVILANTYSKSVLRASAEAIVSEYPFVTYFPSYESVMLTDRKIAWKQDLVHVTEEIVAFNVSRMVEAFVGVADETGELDSEAAAVGRARATGRLRAQAREDFFGRHGRWSERSCEFALEHARHLLKTERAADAVRILARYNSSNMDVAVLTARALTQAGCAGDAIALLDPLCRPDAKSVALWDALIEATIAEGDAERINAVLWRCNVAVPFKASAAYIRTAKWFHVRNDKERAVSLCRAAAEKPLASGTALELVEFLIELGELAAARAALEKVAYPTGPQRKLVERLHAFLA